jgi:hypothetical protein
MNLFMVILRFLHIIGGIFWVGVGWYFTIFFLPRVKAFGQEQGRIMQTMSAPPFPTYMTIASTSVVLSGVLMYWYTSARFNAAWISTPSGIVLTIASLLGIFSFLEGFFVSRPASERMAELGRQAATAGGPPSPAMIQEMQMLAAKLERAVHRTAYVLLLTVIGMATFRYL